MLHLSKQEDYAIILINKLAQSNKLVIPLSEIAKEYNISILFLRNIASELRKKGIISAIEGKNGGYFLNKDLKELKVGEVLSVFSKKPILQCCSLEQINVKKSLKKCPKEKICKVTSIWKKINSEFLEKIYTLSFYDFFDHSNDTNH